MKSGHVVARQRRGGSVQRSWWQSPWLILGTLVGVTAIVVVLLAVGLGGSPAAPAASDRAPAAVVDAATQPDITALATVGVGGATDPFVAPRGGTPLLTADGRPLVALVGADYCPFCAARRWSVVAALSRFGTFTNLGLTASSSSDVFPNTSSFSFHGSSYASRYVGFDGVETETSDRQPLDTPSAAVANALAQYDVPPYTNQAGAIPFLDVGGRLISIGGGFSPSLLQGMTAQQIATAMRDPNNAVGHAIMADANFITAAVCSVTDQQPASVCGAAPIPQIVAMLPGR